jgi:hypothetical protein
MEARDLSSLDLPDAPAGIPNSFDEHINLMFDLVALAYQANLTRIFSMMMAAEVSNMTYNHIGVSDAFHPLSHHQNDKAKMERLVRIQTYHTTVFAKFVAKLAACRTATARFSIIPSFFTAATCRTAMPTTNFHCLRL